MAKRLLLLSLLVLLMGANVLKDPQPLAIPAGLKPAQIHKAIEDAMAWRGWSTETQRAEALKKRRVVASLAIRKHVIIVVLDFSGEALQFVYQDSVNMSYREADGFRFIHGNYNVWTDVLRREIDRRLRAQAGEVVELP